MTIAAVFAIVVTSCVLVCLAALVSAPSKRLVWVNAATAIMLAGWVFVVLNRLLWAIRFGSLSRLIDGLRTTTAAVSTSLVLLGAGAIGVATAWRKRDVIGHIALLLGASTFIWWDTAVVEFDRLRAVGAALFDGDTRASVDPELHLLLLSLVTCAMAAVRVATRWRVFGAVPGHGGHES